LTQANEDERDGLELIVIRMQGDLAALAVRFEALLNGSPVPTEDVERCSATFPHFKLMYQSGVYACPCGQQYVKANGKLIDIGGTDGPVNS